MGSLDAAGIPVPAKTPLSFRKMDTRITQTDAADDVVQTVTNDRPELDRALGSGCIVRDNGVAECTETVVWGLQFGSRSSSDRVSRDGSRDLSVDDNGNETLSVIPTSLAPDTPQISVRSLGTHVDRRDSVTDEQIDAPKSPGLFAAPPQ
jgi:hypothetical protein